MPQHTSLKSASVQCLLPLPYGCVEGTFLRRVKRFSVEFEYNGQRLWAHSNNSGSMIGLLAPSSMAVLSPAANTARKLPYTLERIQLPPNAGGFWVGVNTLLPNRMIEAAFKAGLLPFCDGYTTIKREAKFGASRLDALLTGPNLPPLWVECKNVTMVEDDCAAFPDAQSERAQKHLRELMAIKASGARAAMFYLVQRPDGNCFGPADYIDSAYAELFWEAKAAGVEIYPWRTVNLPYGTNLGKPIPVRKNI